jgi:hypothetical protein
MADTILAVEHPGFTLWASLWALLWLVAWGVGATCVFIGRSFRRSSPSRPSASRRQ